MIHVDRNRIPAPEILTAPLGTGRQERDKAIKFFKVKKNAQKSFKFKAYGDASIRDALNELFHFKCAYCESKYGATQPVDVEHFRPKSAFIFDGTSKKPAYYWLAADWDNLLPSCIDCNRKRKQQIPGQPPQLLGKKDEFPIDNERRRAKHPGKEVNEKRLLLNPCLDQPEQHLEFVLSEPGGEVLVRSKTTRRRVESPMGRESIRVYALQRKGLVEARRDRMILIRARFKTITSLLELLDDDPGNPGLQQLLKDQMAELTGFQQDDQVYAGMARHFIKEFMTTVILPG